MGLACFICTEIWTPTLKLAQAVPGNDPAVSSVLPGHFYALGCFGSQRRRKRVGRGCWPVPEEANRTVTWSMKKTVQNASRTSILYGQCVFETPTTKRRRVQFKAQLSAVGIVFPKAWVPSKRKM